MELFEDVEEREEVDDLLVWWNRFGDLFHSAGWHITDPLFHSVTYSLITRPLGGPSRKTAL